ncbi:MAG: hypothetical protein ABI867_42590 [Kofleriaceae bacterium]
MKSLVLAAVTLLAGCDLYFSNNDDCFETADDVASVRNPDTGECQAFGGCNESCGNCSAETFVNPDWAFCGDSCELLDQETCTITAGCRVALTNDFPTDGPPAFRGCWGVAPSGPIQGRQCEGLDALECSRHDDCSAVYNDHVDDANRTEFAACINEAPAPGCYSDQDCGSGSHCSVSDGDCGEPPGCTDQACPDVCYGRCVMDQPTCASVDCLPGSHCEEHCTDPGGCGATCVPDGDACASTTCPTGNECVVTCDGQDPNNPGCGLCTTSCVPVGTCEGLATETACAGRADCRKVFNGEDCTCYQDGTCECAVLTYDHCETVP